MNENSPNISNDSEYRKVLCILVLDLNLRSRSGSMFYNFLTIAFNIPHIYGIIIQYKNDDLSNACNYERVKYQWEKEID